jgi:serine/threonine protein kinase/Flp pilus assembly protein TadD
MALQPGTRLGSFEVLGPLGAGGMGEVYRARDTRLGRDVAIKVLPESFARDPARAARFEREARLLAAINHPAIGAIYGAEEFDSLRCIIMELVPGETLAERLVRGSLPLEEACDLARQIAEALEAAHEKGVIHRDLKPSNIKVTPEGKIKVLDLGLAKVMEIPSGEDLSQSPTQVDDQTRPGIILGTVEFMSPEQARGKPVDKRTDIWAFGCVFFEMLSGRRAFTGETSTDVFAAILSAEPDWSLLPAVTPPRLRELLARCLRKDANQRLRDIGDARMEIDLMREGREPAAQAPPATRRPWRAAAAALAVIAAAAGIWLALRSLPSRLPDLPEHKQLAVLPFRNLTGDESARWMGVGLAETVSARLSGLPGLQVVTPSAVVTASEQSNEVLRVARALGANLLVAGAFQLQGDRVRLTYRVVNVRDGVEIAADILEGRASDLFGLQDTLADVVAKDLRFPGATRRSTVPPGLDAGQQARYLEAVGLLQRYDRRDGVERALEILRGLSAERPNSAPVQAALGRASLAMFDFTKDRVWEEQAFSASEAARRLDPALAEVDLTLGETFLRKGRPNDAIEAFRRAVTTEPASYEALLGLGRALGQAGHDDADTEATFRRAIALQPASWAAYNQLGGFFADRGRWRDSAAMFQQATRQAADSYRAWSNLGGVLTLGCDFPAALEAYNKALVLKPDHPIAASNLGVTQLWMARYTEAVTSLELAARHAPNSYRVQANLGDAYRALRGKEAESAEAYEKSIALAREQLRLNPNDATAHSWLATTLAKTRRSAEAASEMKRALELDPKDPDILVDAAVVAALAAGKDEAIGWLRKAVERGFCRDIIVRQPEFERFSHDPSFQAIIAAPSKAAGS